MEEKKIGIDVGGVIMDRANDDTDTSFFSDNYLRTTATDGAFVALSCLVDALKGEDGACRVFVVSKCGRVISEKTLAWMAHHRFHEITGIPPENVRFCRKRHEKAPICAELGITGFVDDRLEVLSHLATVPQKLLFRPDQAEIERFAHALPGVSRVDTWIEVLEILLGDKR